jgi:eukaryotic-like serine/threonine-protein kinase
VSQTCPRCGRRYPAGRIGLCPACLLEADLPPAWLGDALELVEEIGRGGMGTVWKARHLRLGRVVAVKFLAPELAADPEFDQRLEREARALALLSHPGIVAVHDFVRDEAGSYIVMEHVEGPPLSALMPLPVEKAVEAAGQLLDALAFAHRQGIVHRDVKPENVLVDASGRVKVSDFGIARALGGGAGGSVTTTGRVIGTPRYMAPELLAGAEPDPRMDVFSVGVMLREMVAGRDGAGALPPGLEHLLATAVAHDPRQRYASAEEMGRALAGLAAGGMGDDLPPDERNWLRAVALLQTLATAVALWAFLLSVTPRSVPSGDVTPLVMIRPEPLPDGRVLSRARFETWPTLAALAAISVAVAGYGVVRRHWRHAGLDRPQPERPVRESRLVLAWGAVSAAVYAVRRLLESRGVDWGFVYVPIFGGLIEIAALFFFWMAILQAWRTSRSLAREWALWLGALLALLPPATDLLRALRQPLTP